MIAFSISAPTQSPTRSALIPALSNSCPESACNRPRRDRVRNSAEDQKPGRERRHFADRLTFAFGAQQRDGDQAFF
jgi:hypothetical protein